jgi:3-hydroxyisobutyrate dehydrogenase-like beta-hydroxyacid dehydrogenase
MSPKNSAEIRYRLDEMDISFLAAPVSGGLPGLPPEKWSSLKYGY